MKSEIIVKCDPNYKPFTLPYLVKLLQKHGLQLQISTFIHSDVKVDAQRREDLLNFLPNIEGKFDLKLCLIWTNSVWNHLEFLLNGKNLIGEVNLMKYFAFKFNLLSRSDLDESKLDEIQSEFLPKNDLKLVAKWLQIQTYIAGSNFGISDLVVFSHVNEIPKTKLPDEVQNWMKKCQNFFSSELQNGAQTEISTEIGKELLFDFLSKNEIKFDTIDHPEVFTVETMMPYLTNIAGAVSKNLFLKDKKGGLYLLSALHDKAVNMAEIGKKIKAPGGLRFASEEILFDTLKVRQGCVTAFALLHDKDQKVTFLLDSDILKHPRVYFHPLVNNATTGVSIEDFEKFVKLTNHNIVQVQL